MAVHKTLVRAFVATAAMASVANSHAIAVPAGHLDARTYPTPTCDPSHTVTQTETKTVTSWKALLTITIGGGTHTKTETKTEICTVTDTETVTETATSTTTVTPTYTPPSCPTQCPAPPSCNNLGFDWAYYNNSARNTDTTYSTFHPDSYKKVAPIFVGTTSYVGGLYNSQGTQNTGPIYNSGRDFKLDFFGLNHHAYIYACEAGTYSITIPYSNDAVYLWTGAKAYSGWTDNNADAKALYNQPDHIAGHASFNLNIPANSYVPIRFFYGQAQYGGGFNFNITTPSGQVIVSNAETFSPYVVRYSCDGTTAPAFPAFGKET
ncbi:conidiospore surface [Trichoderma arundinaceum]|uniref:Conidiospore surface n=1 Tax=Trichoderma arundinaceum TaxID=490622 RepID=A0A395NP89_TRIAR|nr:conidiospore surface [Trichoderma arundinaceum]